MMVEKIDLSFENAMEELDAIVGRLSGGNMTLDDMVKLYERGSALCEHCVTLLDDYEKRLDAVDGAPEGDVG